MTLARQLTAVSAEVPSAWVDALLDALSVHPFVPTAWEDVERGTCRIEIFLEDAAAADAAADVLRRTGAAFGLALVPAAALVAPEDWTESWKRFFHTERVSSRIVIRPAWEPYTARPGEVVIDIEPGMSFGTGRHGTTRACLQFLDRMAVSRAAGSVLDVGCGSGILAIGAAKLGFRSVRGFDNDPDAVAIARQNARENAVDVDFFVCDLAANTAQADVVVANILAPVLIQHAAVLAHAVAPVADAALVVSGILDAQYAAVLRAFDAYGFREREHQLIEGWRSGWLHRKQ